MTAGLIFALRDYLRHGLKVTYISRRPIRTSFRWGTRSALAKEVSLECSFSLAVELLSPMQWNKICTGSGGTEDVMIIDHTIVGDGGLGERISSPKVSEGGLTVKFTACAWPSGLDSAT